MKKKTIFIVIILAIALLGFTTYINILCLTENIEGLVSYINYYPNYSQYQPYYNFIRGIIEWSVCLLSSILSIGILVIVLLNINKKQN